MAGKLTIAGSAAEAVSLKDAGSVFLAGGTEINRLGSTITAGHLISIKRVEELKEIKESVGLVSIGAGCTFSEVLASDLVPAYMKEACRFMASQTKRNMATIGGCAALLRSDSYIIPTLMAAKAKLELLEKEIQGRGEARFRQRVAGCHHLRGNRRNLHQHLFHPGLQDSFILDGENALYGRPSLRQQIDIRSQDPRDSSDHSFHAQHHFREGVLLDSDQK